jgi:uncharacterized membrane protein YedE/YeeE
MNAKLLAWLLLPVVGLVVAGWLAIWLLHALLGVLVYVLVGALVVGGVVYVGGRVRRALAPGTRTRRQLDAAAETYRMRDR